MYGWRAKIGMLIPTNNTIIEPEAASRAPEGVTFHATRMVSSRTGHGSVEGLQNLVTNVDRAAEELSITNVDAMIYGCLSTSFAIENWETDFREKVAKWADVPAITAFEATTLAIKSFGAKKVAVLCPYGAELQKLAYPAFERAGLKIANLKSINVTGLQAVCQVPVGDVYRAAREIDMNGADILCILATDLSTIGVVSAVERDLGIPVVSTNQALIWASLGMSRIKDQVNESGLLFKNTFSAQSFIGSGKTSLKIQ